MQQMKPETVRDVAGMLWSGGLPVWPFPVPAAALYNEAPALCKHKPLGMLNMTEQSQALIRNVIEHINIWGC